MKKLEIQTNKSLLIVEYATEKECENETVVLQAFTTVIEFGYTLEFICSGSDLTEEIAAGITENMYSESESSIMYRDHKAQYADEVVYTSLESFISAIEAQGWYWGENPLGNKEPEDISDLGEFTQMMRRKHKAWKEAESRTFHPERVIIFEIVEG